MFHLLLFVYVMILDTIYLRRIPIEEDIEKLNYVVQLLDSRGGLGLSDPTLFRARHFYEIAIFPP